MSQADPTDERSPLGTRPEAEAHPRSDAEELLARAARIRERSQELIDELGPEHPLVAHAISRAEALENEAKTPGRIDLR